MLSCKCMHIFHKSNKTKNFEREEEIFLPVVIFISVIQKKKRIEWMGLPKKQSYTHCSERGGINVEDVFELAALQY